MTALHPWVISTCSWALRILLKPGNFLEIDFSVHAGVQTPHVIGPLLVYSCRWWLRLWSELSIMEQRFVLYYALRTCLDVCTSWMPYYWHFVTPITNVHYFSRQLTTGTIAKTLSDPFNLPRTLPDIRCKTYPFWILYFNVWRAVYIKNT